jgi:hypothetical protein
MCLTIGPYITGNQSWHIHICRLKHIIEKRGSLSSFDGILQAKIQRYEKFSHSESEHGNVLFAGLISPVPLERSNRLSIWSKLPEQTLRAISSDVIRILTNYGIHPDLIAIMIALANFTTQWDLHHSIPNWKSTWPSAPRICIG